MRRALNCPGPSKRPDMLRAIVTFPLRFCGIVVALACVLFGYGVYVALNARLDVFPDFVSPPVTVQAEASGLAPEQVEALVTLPLETVISALGGQRAALAIRFDPFSFGHLIICGWHRKPLPLQSTCRLG